MNLREIDALIATYVFHMTVTWRPCWRDPECGSLEDIGWWDDRADANGRDELHPCYETIPAAYEFPASYAPIPMYTTDIAAAWKIIDALRSSPDSMVWVDVRDSLFDLVSEADAPMTICRAALAAVGHPLPGDLAHPYST